MSLWPRTKSARAIVIASVLLAAASGLLLAQPRARVALRLVRGFSPLGSDPRVLYEAGASEMALAVADALPAAIERVEQCHGDPLEPGFRVYVCATRESFALRTGQSADFPVRGMALPWDIWVSPTAFTFFGQDTHQGTLAHELSHLHLQQSLGWWRRTRNVPAWFQEGLADWVAGTGYE